MAGNITDKLDRVSDSDTSRPVIAQLASPGKTVGASSINITDATGWTTTTKIHFCIYNVITVAGTTVKDASSQVDFVGTLAGTTISNLVVTGGTDRTYTAGAYVELTPTAKWAKDLFDNISTHANQNGSLKDGVISSSTQLTDSVVITSKVADGAITNAKLGSDIAGPWQPWIPTWTSFTPGSATVVAKYTQSGKRVNFRLSVTLNSSSITGKIQFTLPVAANTDLSTNEGTVVATVKYLDAGIATYYGACKVSPNLPTVAELVIYNAAGTYLQANDTGSGAPFNWGNGDAFMLSGAYEAA